MKKTKPSTAAKPSSTPRARKPAATSKRPAARKPARPHQPADPLRARVDRVCQLLNDKKGQDVVVLHVAELSSVTDYMILCSGLNTPHLRALADEVARGLRTETPPVACHRRAGSAESEWLVLDYIDLVVHLFTPTTRAYYAIEQLWKDAPKGP